MDALVEPRKVAAPAPLIDPYGRSISYVRVSVTDRCDFRCVYCMSEHMTFLPRRDLLTLEELERLCVAFISRGTKRLRITGGEPLMRHNVMRLFHKLHLHLRAGALEELTLTTNGSQLARFAHELVDCGVRRINISLDTLKQDVFRQLTRNGDFNQVMAGIHAAHAAGLRIKLNVVALKGVNEEEFLPLLQFAHDHGFDITFIEVMPLGELGAFQRIDQYLPMSAVQENIAQRFTLHATDHRTGGPARYMRVAETGGRVGFITPMTHNFCESCNRVRVTCTGTLYMCLGQEDAADLRKPLRESSEDAALHAALDAAIARKPKGHDFVIDRTSPPSVASRHMSMTGG